jgi:hypothetical protein
MRLTAAEQIMPQLPGGALALLPKAVLDEVAARKVMSSIRRTPPVWSEHRVTALCRQGLGSVRLHLIYLVLSELSNSCASGNGVRSAYKASSERRRAQGMVGGCSPEGDEGREERPSHR